MLEIFLEWLLNDVGTDLNWFDSIYDRAKKEVDEAPTSQQIALRIFIKFYEQRFGAED